MGATNLEVKKHGLTTYQSKTKAVARHFHQGQVKVAIFHGLNRHKVAPNLMTNDIVLTTYETLRSEWSTDRANSVLYQSHGGWARIVLDEGIPSPYERLI